MDPYLETERLVLRRFTPADAELLFELDSDPEVMRFLSGGRPTPRETIERRILPRLLDEYGRSPHFGCWAALARSGGEFLGWFSFRPLRPARPEVVELGYRLRRAAWGRGYAAEGARALVRRGFAELGVARVVATTYEANVPSRRVLEKLGMALVRRYRPSPAELLAGATYEVDPGALFDGDDLEYALDRTDWEQRQAAGPTGVRR